MILNFKVNAESAIAHLKAVQKQIPFIRSRSVDLTIKDVQKAEQTHIRASFILRRAAFILRTVKILKFATKADPTSTVAIDPARPILAKFESQTIKTPQRGHRLAVPLEARKTKGSIVPPSLRPGGLGIKGFKIKTKTGKELLVKEKGVRAQKKTGKRLDVLYVLKASVPIRPVLTFMQIGERTARRQFPIRANEAMIHAFRTAR
jgi:hypothetical protein